MSYELLGMGKSYLTWDVRIMCKPKKWSPRERRWMSLEKSIKTLQCTRNDDVQPHLWSVILHFKTSTRNSEVNRFMHFFFFFSEAGKERQWKISKSSQPRLAWLFLLPFLVPNFLPNLLIFPLLRDMLVQGLLSVGKGEAEEGFLLVQIMSRRFQQSVLLGGSL